MELKRKHKIIWAICLCSAFGLFQHSYSSVQYSTEWWGVLHLSSEDNGEQSEDDRCCQTQIQIEQQCWHPSDQPHHLVGVSVTWLCVTVKRRMDKETLQTQHHSNKRPLTRSILLLFHSVTISEYCLNMPFRFTKTIAARIA